MTETAVQLVDEASEHVVFVKIHECPKVSESIKELKTAIIESVEAITGKARFSHQPYMVLDGEIYSLNWNHPEAGKFTLKADSNSYEYVSWVRAIKKVMQEAKSCGSNS